MLQDVAQEIIIHNLKDASKNTYKSVCPSVGLSRLCKEMMEIDIFAIFMKNLK